MLNPRDRDFQFCARSKNPGNPEDRDRGPKFQENPENPELNIPTTRGSGFIFSGYPEIISCYY